MQPTTQNQQYPKNATVDLIFPITDNGVQYKTITLRRPTVDDTLTADALNRVSGDSGTDAQEELILFSRLCGMSLLALRQLDLIDYRNLSKAFKSFFAPIETGSSTTALS